MNEAIAQEAARKFKGVLTPLKRCLLISHEGEKSESLASDGVNEVKCNNRKPRVIFLSQGKITQEMGSQIRRQKEGRKWCQAVLDTLHVTFFDQSYVTSVEALANNFVVGF